MAWTTPRTWVTSEVVTAAIMNAHVRDNLTETSAATVTTAGDIAYADGNKSMGSRLGIGATGSFLVSTGSAPAWNAIASSGLTNTTAITYTITSYVDMDTAGGSTPNGDATAATVTIRGSAALVIVRARISNNTAGSAVFIGHRISGATTSVAADNQAFYFASDSADQVLAAGATFYRSGLNAGSNTFTMQTRVSGGTATTQRTEITVIPL